MQFCKALRVSHSSMRFPKGCYGQMRHIYVPCIFFNHCVSEPVVLIEMGLVFCDLGTLYANAVFQVMTFLK